MTIAETVVCAWVALLVFLTRRHMLISLDD
jgi:hypothetical protein